MTRRLCAPTIHCPCWVHNLARGARTGALTAAVMILFSWSVTSNAQEHELGIEPNQQELTVSDPENGQVLARKLCVACHLIENTNDGVTRADVPSFSAIAKRPNQSAETLTNWLMAPHAPMPDPHLTRKEIRNLVGYILSLRTAQ
ncbi:MAG: cytochrome c [Hyphomicrobium sp.]|nr:cytochrome c [Hyphomicrobium sp.]